MRKGNIEMDQSVWIRKKRGGRCRMILDLAQSREFSCGYCQASKIPLIGLRFTHSLQKCSRCKNISYCNRTCQRKHWCFHKFHCLEKIVK